MASSGVRFEVPLDVTDAGSNSTGFVGLGGLLGDIKEREPAHARPPSPPRLSAPKTGFPAHRPRRGRAPKASVESNDLSKYRGNESTQDASGMRPQASMRMSIDRENQDRLAAMTEQEILDAKRELESNLSPSLLETLLKRSRLEEGQKELGATERAQDSATAERSSQSSGTKSTENGASIQHVQLKPDRSKEQESSAASPPSSGVPHPPLPDPKQSLHDVPQFHFPEPPTPPDLDPDDPDFQEKLHNTYFPSLPSDPTSLSWMAPPKAEESAAYSPSSETLAVSSLRFDFRGRLLPPRLSSQIPTTKGLHHHGHAPERAGYTIPELSHLARSVVASQQCISYQTLGRILFRLGKGEFGSEGEALHDGIWELIDKGKALDSMIEVAAHGEGGNRSVWATATDAVWLYRKGGGVKWRGR